ncbi:hypothetical protein K491DRAFT_177562 [Lophiostoma macrostomum CBS 122681]|uniref:Uncharacterized protein n=1 Tax=Lophiostoma macrostomum CBS 122681 TaxID=1314788 RepID=A0A6A6TUV8_9PLEO|nr:hypothetical protein K491DRAFT_177562 [Lophiostoma macrostomum CBS 122681]
MPTYNATGVRVRLGVTHLSDTVTQHIKLRKNEAAVNSDVAEKKLRESELLREKNVPFPGDADGLRVNFLKNVPFLQVKASRELFKAGSYDEGARAGPQGRSSETPFNNLPPDLSNNAGPYFNYALNDTPAAPPLTGHSVFSATQAPDQDAVPKALVLYVTLSEKSFLPSFKDGKHQHLLIDVFFNGILASSVLMHLRDIGGGVKSFDQMFAGTRAHNLAERPWVILPSAQHKDRNSAGRDHNLSASSRWQQICAALMKEANERGLDRSGKRSPTGDYFESLANMKMPEDVEHMQSPGGQLFGVIDMVITAGSGKKTDEGYMWEPSRLRDERYHKIQPGEFTEMQQRDPDNFTDSEQDAEGETDPDFGRTPHISRQLRDVIPASSSEFPIPDSPSLIPSASSAVTPMEFVSLKDLDLASSIDQRSTPLDFTASSIPFALMQKIPNGLPAVPLSNSSNALHEAATSGVLMHGLFAATGGLTNMPSGDEYHSGDVYAPPQAHPFTPIRRPLPMFPFLGPAVCNGPLPAIGMFSALPKPIPRLSRDSGIIDPDLPPSSFLLTRLVITGKIGRVIVDHRWKVPQRVALNQPRGRSRNPSPHKKRRLSHGDEDYVETATAYRSRAKKITANRLTTPPPTSPRQADPDTTVSVDKNRMSSAHYGQLLSESEKPSVPGPALVYNTTPSSAGAAGKLMDGNDAHILSIAPTESSLAPPNGINTQNDRANPFILDDPEGLLRRRTKPARGSMTDSALLAAPSPMPAKRSMTAKGRVPNLQDFHSSGSSLSSAPDTPELEAQRNDFTQNDERQLTKAAVPMSPKRPPHTPAARLSSSSRAQSMVTEPLASAKTSITEWLQAKQKKNLRGPFPWPTNKNPLLNQGCIIRFAEDGENGKAPLRQIKSERQGVFTEDMVVVGMRYFVPG